MQINPQLVFLGQVTLPLLRRARELDVAFTLRLGEVDAPSADVAGAIGAVIEHNLVAVAPAPLSATLFPVDAGLQLTLTGVGLHTPLLPSVSSRHVTLGRTELLEVVF